MSASNVDYTNLYWLSDPIATRPLRLTPTGNSRSLTWEQLVGLYTGRFLPEQPVQFTAFSGGQATDILWTGFSPLMVISERVVGLFKESNITGWSTFPVEVLGRKGERLPGYWGLVITGRAGRIDKTRGEIVTKPPAVPGGVPRQVRRGLYFDATQWDGSDISVIGHGGFIIVKARVKQLFDRARVRNIVLTPLPEVELDLALDEITQRHPSSQPSKPE